MNPFRRRSRTEKPSAPQEATVITSFSEPTEITDNDPLAAYLLGAAGPVELDKVDLDSPALRALKEAQVMLVVPLISQGELVGTINLGRRLSDQPYSTDDRKLLAGLASQVAPAIRLAQLVAEQQAEAEERERIAHELEVAALIQQTLLPKTLPEIPGWEIDAYYRPAQAVGGDFYDFVPLEDGRYVILIGDVTGHGVPAALVMASCRSILRSATQQHSDPGAILATTNEALIVDIPPNMFVTCLCAVLDPDTSTLQFSNAGHNLPYASSSDGVTELRATGMPLGLMPDMQYDVVEATIEPGTALLLSSDGLTEAHNPEREMYGFGRLRELLEHSYSDTDLLKSILTDLDRFSQGVEQEDDVTLVVVRHTSSARSSAATFSGVTDLGSFEIPSVPGSERVVMDRVLEMVASVGMQPDRLQRLGSAVAEAAMNAIEHGNKNRPELTVSVFVAVNDGAVHVSIADKGTSPAPLTAVKEPDLEAKLEGLDTPRGWGLFLIERLVDEVITSQTDDGNVVELVMRLEAKT
jgi:serine phosphatase RsbU (regulator of sigma subunit)/anti-sigma regulatory factor (Ser/Thr protein kinase)